MAQFTINIEKIDPPQKVFVCCCGFRHCRCFSFALLCVVFSFVSIKWPWVGMLSSENRSEDYSDRMCMIVELLCPCVWGHAHGPFEVIMTYDHDDVFVLYLSCLACGSWKFEVMLMGLFVWGHDDLYMCVCVGLLEHVTVTVVTWVCRKDGR